MFTPVQVINLGLGKIAASSISRIDPAQTSLEKFCAAGYDHWKRSELTKRRWVFAIEDGYQLTQIGVLEKGDRKYRYELPVDCLRPIRTRKSEWVQRKRELRSAYDTLAVDYIMNVDETDFDPLFVEVLACRVALETVEFVTQSNTKKEHADALYTKAVDDAARSNAFVVGNQDIAEDDETFDFITGRFGHG